MELDSNEGDGGSHKEPAGKKTVYANPFAAAAAGSSAQKRKKGTVLQTPPWVEKYRPKSVSDVVYQEEVVSVLKKCLDGGDFPHLLFYGPPGTGKTSTILALAHQMFGPIYKERVLELNSSDERGIDVIRTKVKNFASLKTSSKLPDGTSCPAMRIVILDEADSMTTHAQSALRRIIESTTESTRFCLICNYITRIIEPITSRCNKFRFKPLTEDLVVDKLRYIAEIENITYNSEEEGNEIFKEICRISEGDLRKAITLLQSVFRLKAKPLDPSVPDSNIKGAHIELADIHEISGVITTSHLNVVMQSVRSGDILKLERSVTSIIDNGYAASQLLNQLVDVILADKELTWKQKCPLLKKLAGADNKLLEGASEYLQLFDVFTAYQRSLKDQSGESISRSFRID